MLCSRSTKRICWRRWVTIEIERNLPVSTIHELLSDHDKLALVSPSARLDAELLLAHCLGCSRTYLYTWPERSVTPLEQQQFRELLARRVAGEPVAYITGQREFWSLQLHVSPCTLIPRPDTERLVEVALAELKEGEASVLDLGSGSGAIALALAKERPLWRLTGVDIEPQAVELATTNAHRHALDNVRFLQSDWFTGLAHDERFHMIVSNPPYIDSEDPHLTQGDVRFEPRRALVAQKQGVAAIATIAADARAFLRPRGWLLFEHGALQGPAVRTLLSQAGFTDVTTWHDWGRRERVSGGLAP